MSNKYDKNNAAVETAKEVKEETVITESAPAGTPVAKAEEKKVEEVKPVKTEAPKTEAPVEKKEEVKEEPVEINKEEALANSYKTRHVIIRANTNYSKIISKNLPYEGDVTEILIKASLKAGHIVIEKDGETMKVLSLDDQNNIVETLAGTGKEEKKENEKKENA